MNVPGIEISDRARLCRTPLVSVAMITYNHGRFIRRAIEGVMEQVTSFEFELIIGDDCSTDDTSEICRELQRKYPDRIRLIWWHENVSHGRSGNLRRVSERCRGKYVALCEGDDYWTDPHKLQKQVDYLESHPECAICFHPVRVVWDDGRHPDSVFPIDFHRYALARPNLHELLKKNFIQTNSVMYRWNADGKLWGDFPLYELPGDWMLHLLHARAGRIGYIDEIMSVYRRNATGLWTGAWTDEGWFRRVGLRNLYFYHSLSRLFRVNRNGVLRRLSLATLGSLLAEAKSSDVEIAKKVLKLYRPSCLWLWLSSVIAGVYGVMCFLLPTRYRHAFETRHIVWRIIACRAALIRRFYGRCSLMREG